ncbi:MAG: 4-coumarate--CoA ligase family protein [Armatimonadetes bacterium]|nr:4-coumarate--CoA ligase family protein [Armatimonadota bacterium]CUU37952.1 Acyl-CoA synthetase (AMP-forming)/AMP-acid ligase II [Armatimonadetes bacterium DC]
MIFKSPYAEVSIPSVGLVPFVYQHAESFGEKPALIDGPSGRTLTYAQLWAGVRRVAGNLAKRGLKKGEVVGIYCPNLPEYALAFHGTALAGGVVTTANPLYTADELAYQLKDSGAKFLVTVGPLLEKALPAAEKAGVQEVFVIGEGEGATPFTVLLADAEPPEVAIDPQNDLVVLPYSSGTTGLPKGVMLTHYNLVANMCQVLGSGVNLRSDERVIGVLPFYHIYGMLVILNLCLYKGITIVTMPRFDLEQFLKLMQDYRITRANLVPPIILALAKHPIVSQYDLSHLRIIMSGAAPLSAELAQEASQRLGCIVMQGYGLTETSPVTHVNPEDPAKIKLGSVGPPIANTECMVVDLNTGNPKGVREEGEIWIRGPQVMKGYLNAPEATAFTLTPEGWLRTGDVGYVDEDGYFYIVDRVKEMIKYKGLQIAPAELEAVLLTHPAVADAAVIPSPDPEAGEVPKAFVVLKPDIPTTAEDLMEYVAERVAPFKKIRRIEFVQQIPKSPSGKILRRVLVQQERERHQT